MPFLAIEPGREGDQVVGETQMVDRHGRYVQHDLAIADHFARHLHTCLRTIDQQMGVMPLSQIHSCSARTR